MVTEKERMLLEIVLAVIFIAFLVVLSIVVINASEGPKSETETTITNSFNTYNYNAYPLTTRTQRTALTTKPHIIDDFNDGFYGDYKRSYARGYARVYYSEDFYDNIYDSGKRHLFYDADSRQEISRGLFGNDINRYEVYVRNRDYTGGYFKVVFRFEDNYGNEDSYAIMHYVPAREEKLFLLKDISPSRYEYSSGWYEVDSLSKAKTGNLYIN